MVFHREHNAHMPCEMQKFMNIWPRRPQQDFTQPPTIRLHRHPHWPNSCKIFCQNSSVLTCINCTVCQCSWCCVEGISLLITPATILSPFYPDLWMCPVRDSGLFTFLAQILIVPIQLLYFPSFTEHGSRMRNFTHTHILSLSLSFQYPDCFLFLQCLAVCLTNLCRFLSYTWYVRPFLAVSWQPHCLLPHIRTAGSVVPCFDLPQSQRSVNNPCLVLS